MKSTILFLLLSAITATFTGTMMAQTGKQYMYETVAGDPLKARIYKLDNGLTVYMSVFPEAPRIQTYIAVRAGSKNDPAETTGLAHYFEHMMFKGTENIGTTSWEIEKPMIDSIEALFEVYRLEKDELKRAAIYRNIDSLSLEASRIAIPNEYDKLMDVLGSQGSNAGTSNDYTIYMENIPSNQVENWAIIQAERFSNPVLRIFHTELETVYEEKNMSLASDSRKVNETMLSLLFPNHPYGRQTTLGEAEHLKNPSMKNIREFYSKYYVPNNMAISLSGDFDPDKVIRIIDKNFGKLKPGKVPPLKYAPRPLLTAPVTREITGLEAESVRVAFGFDGGANSDQAPLINMLVQVLYNGRAGLIDLNLVQKQQVMSANGYANAMGDYTALIFNAKPKANQTLDEVRDLILQQVDLVRKGDFPDWMLEAAINNAKLNLLRQYESNQGRAMTMATSFMYQITYERVVSYIATLSKVTKDDLVAFATANLKDNYAVIYKRQGHPEESARIVKPPITPIHINRESESAFLKKIRSTQVPAIEPVFLNYQKDLRKFTMGNNARVLYKENTENATFSLVYFLRLGTNNDRMLEVAARYISYLGTAAMSPEQIRQEFYKLACTFNINVSEDETSIALSGLSDNFEKALSLLEQVLNDAIPDEAALKNLVSDLDKARREAKSNQNEIFSALVSYGTYGSQSPYKNILSENELNMITAAQMIERIRELCGYKHQVLYYGNASPSVLMGMLNKYHEVPGMLKNPPKPVIFTQLPTLSNTVLCANYNAKQSKIQTIHKGERYNPGLVPSATLFNAYFGTNIVFQELREKRGLAYTAYARYQEPNDPERSFLSTGYIATQSDKIGDALTAFNDLFNDMPVSDVTFGISKNMVLNRIRTERITRMNVIWNFLKAEKMGLTTDLRKSVFDKVSAMTLPDVIAFNADYIKDKPKTYLILGNEKEIDQAVIGGFGIVKKLTLEEIFGY
jgi:predicted Zn-dependent peptidase